MKGTNGRTGGRTGGGRKRPGSAGASCQRNDNLNCATIVRKAKAELRAEARLSKLAAREESEESLSFAENLKRSLTKRSNKPGSGCGDKSFDAESYPPSLPVRISFVQNARTLSELGEFV